MLHFGSLFVSWANQLSFLFTIHFTCQNKQKKEQEHYSYDFSLSKVNYLNFFNNKVSKFLVQIKNIKIYLSQ